MNAEHSQRGKNKGFILVMLLVGFAALGTVTYIINSKSAPAVQTSGFKPGPPPPGTPPAGKVWSYEHGHWHDAR